MCGIAKMNLLFLSIVCLSVLAHAKPGCGNSDVVGSVQQVQNQCSQVPLKNQNVPLYNTGSPNAGLTGQRCNGVPYGGDHNGRGYSTGVPYGGDHNGRGYSTGGCNGSNSVGNYNGDGRDASAIIEKITEEIRKLQGKDISHSNASSMKESIWTIYVDLLLLLGLDFLGVGLELLINLFAALEILATLYVNLCGIINVHFSLDISIFLNILAAIRLLFGAGYKNFTGSASQSVADYSSSLSICLNIALNVCLRIYAGLGFFLGVSVSLLASVDVFLLVRLALSLLYAVLHLDLILVLFLNLNLTIFGTIILALDAYFGLGISGGGFSGQHDSITNALTACQENWMQRFNGQSTFLLGLGIAVTLSLSLYVNLAFILFIRVLFPLGQHFSQGSRYAPGWQKSCDNTQRYMEKYCGMIENSECPCSR